MKLASALLLVLTLCVEADVAEAAGRIPYGGVVRVSLTPEAVPTWRDSVSDCFLFQRRAGELSPELASDRGRWQDDSLLLTLAPGARFHNGDSIEARHVVSSLKRAGREASPLRAALALLMPRAVSPAVVDVRVPSGMGEDVLRRLLAHPASAIRHQGSRCGAFRPAGLTGDELHFEAHLGHPQGRPWLDGVTLTRVEAPERAVEALVFQKADVTETASSRNRAVADASPRGWSTVFAVPNARWRGRDGLAFRRRVAWLNRKTRFARHVDAPFERARGALPSGYASPLRQEAVRTAPLDLGELVVAYPAGRADLKELAEVLRDTLRVDFEGTPRVLPVEGLTIERASRGEHSWTLALVTLEWTGLDASQAVIELADRASLPTPDALGVLREGHEAWLTQRHDEQALIPVLHLRKPAFHRGNWHLAQGAGQSGGLAWSWRQR